MKDSIFETLKELSNNQHRVKRNESQGVKGFLKADGNTVKGNRKDPSYIYLEDNQVKERQISELLDSAGSAYINKVMNYNSARLIHDSIFH